MFVAPSTVLYTNCPGAPRLDSLASDTHLEELSKKLLTNSEGLRLQVVEKDGHYFTLNNTRLHVCRWLETHGHCRTVRIETVPLKSVPEGIKRMMVVPPTAQLPVTMSATQPVMTITYEPMERRPRTADDDNEDHSCSDDSDCGDSDSSHDEADKHDQHPRRRRHSEDSVHEEDSSLL